MSNPLPVSRATPYPSAPKQGTAISRYARTRGDNGGHGATGRGRISGGRVGTIFAKG